MQVRSLTLLVALLWVIDASAQDVSKPVPGAISSAKTPSEADKQGKILLLFEADEKDKTDWMASREPHPLYRTPTGIATYVDPAALEKSFRELMQRVGGVFNLNNTSIPGGYTVDEIELHLNITAEGSIGIIASGKAGGEAGIAVTLRRPARATDVPSQPRP